MVQTLIDQLDPRGMEYYSLLGANRLLVINEARRGKSLNEFELSLRIAINSAWDAIHDNDDSRIESITDKVLSVPDLYDGSKYGIDIEPSAASVYALQSLRGDEKRYAKLVWNQSGAYA